MLIDNYSRFSKLWHALNGDYGRSVEEETVQLVFTALNEYTLDEVSYAISCVIGRNKYLPNVAEIIEYIEFGGLSREVTEFKALTVFQDFLQNYSAYSDFVIADDRAVLAFYAVFGTHSRFGQQPDNYDAVMANQKKFINAYISCSPRHFVEVIKEKCIQPARVHTSDMTVVFIGDKDRCRAIADAFYGRDGYKVIQRSIKRNYSSKDAYIGVKEEA